MQILTLQDSQFHSEMPHESAFHSLWVVLKQVVLETHFYSLNKNDLKANCTPGTVENTGATTMIKSDRPDPCLCEAPCFGDLVHQYHGVVVNKEVAQS